MEIQGWEDISGKILTTTAKVEHYYVPQIVVKGFTNPTAFTLHRSQMR